MWRHIKECSLQHFSNCKELEIIKVPYSMLDILDQLTQISFYLLHFEIRKLKTSFSRHYWSYGSGYKLGHLHRGVHVEFESEVTTSFCFYLVISEVKQGGGNVQIFCYCCYLINCFHSSSIPGSTPQIPGCWEEVLVEVTGAMLTSWLCTALEVAAVATLVGQSHIVLEDTPKVPSENPLFWLFLMIL